jgi:adenosylcobinamide-GDP ribazoletransferase
MGRLLLALQFLTRLPVRAPWPGSPGERAAAVPFYPLVGLLLGLLLAALHGTLGATDPGVQAALLLAAWVLLTGALHLDGLADTVDAWVGGQGDRARTLAIMKDSRTGPMGATALGVVLLAKFAALQALLGAGSWGAVVLAPVMGRALLVAVLLWLPYVRPGGLGAELAGHLPRETAQVAVAVAAAALLLAGSAGLWMLVAATAVFLGARAALLNRLGGTTGDTAGALCEIGEAAVLLAAAMAL